MYADRFAASERHAARAPAVGRATGQGDLFPLIFPMLGTALWLQGRVAESAAALDDGIDGARLVENLGVGSLTGRELEVARLIVDRKTNADAPVSDPLRVGGLR